MDICKHCWIEVVKQKTMKPVLGTEDDNSPRWVHKTQVNDVGNPFCGRQFLEDDDIESVSSVEEA
jgi:hypothetical protein